MANTGSFGAAIGGGDALTQAMQRRGMDASVLDQVSPAAPTGASSVAPAVPTGGGGAAGVPGGADQGALGTLSAPAAPSAAEQSVPARSAEMEIALKALAGVVKTENKIAETLVGTR